MNRSVRYLGALLGLLFLVAAPATAQGCLNTSQYPGNSIIPDPFGAVTTISTCSFEAEYSVVTNIVASGTYEFTFSSGGYITVRQGTYDGPILAQGLSPVQATAVDGTDLFPHWNVNAAAQDEIEALLARARTIAVVGLFSDASRPTYRVAKALQGFGYRIIPVNPSGTTILGERTVPDLDHLEAALGPGGKPDVVDVFRRPEHVAAIR